MCIVWLLFGCQYQYLERLIPEMTSVVVLEESPGHRGSLRINLQVLVLVLGPQVLVLVLRPQVLVLTL